MLRIAPVLVYGKIRDSCEIYVITGAFAVRLMVRLLRLGVKWIKNALHEGKTGYKTAYKPHLSYTSCTVVYRRVPYCARLVP